MMRIDTTMPAPRKGIHRHLYVQVLIAITAGALIGHFYPTSASP
jgi:aerobic C4-dicarboxylate transport protein